MMRSCIGAPTTNKSQSVGGGVIKVYLSVKNKHNRIDQTKMETNIVLVSFLCQTAVSINKIMDVMGKA